MLPFLESTFVQTGRFQSPRTIGQGANGHVYAAIDTGTGRLVAIKEALPSRQDFQDVVARFETEIRIQASLQQTNIITVFSAEKDSQSNGRYLICEYANGGSLADYLDRYGVLCEEQAIKVTIDICTALEKVWSKRIVHRDVKPGNIFLIVNDHDPQAIETAKLGDFGIALDRKESLQTRPPGMLAPGTPTYMSPEQEQGLLLDVQSDIYSLGCTLWEMLTRQEYKLLAKKGVPDLHAHNPTTSTGIAAIIQKATERECAERYETPQEMIRDLTALLDSKQASQHPSPHQRRFPTVIAGIAFLAIAGLTGGGWAIATLLGRPVQSSRISRITVEPSPIASATTVSTSLPLFISASLSPTPTITPHPAPITSGSTPRPTSTATPTPEPPICRVAPPSLILRVGPGKVYPQLAVLSQGTRLTPLGFRADGFPAGGRWLYVQVQGGDDTSKTGWVSGEPAFSQCNPTVVFDALPTIVPISPTPSNTPTKTPIPTNTPTSTPTSTPTATRTPTLTPTAIPTPQIVDIAGHWYAADGGMMLTQSDRDRTTFSGTFASEGVEGQILNGKISRGSTTIFESENDPWILTGEYSFVQDRQTITVPFQWEIKPDGTTFKGNGIHAQQPWCGAKDGMPFEDGCSFAGTWSINISTWSNCSMTVNRTDLNVTGQFTCPGVGTTGQLAGTIRRDSAFGTIVSANPPQDFGWDFRMPWDSFHGFYGSATSRPQNQFCGWRNGQSPPPICGSYLQ